MIDSRKHLRVIDFGTAEVFLVKGKNTDIYNSYCRIREKFAPMQVRESIDGKAPFYDELDLKPSNTIYRKHEKLEVCNPKIKHTINFMEEYNDNIKNRKSFVGTVYYVAPEMLENQNVDPGCDLWALGIILNKMLTSEYLFNEPNDYLTFEAIRKGEYKLQTDLPDDAKDLISRLLVKDPKDRLGNGPEGSDNDFKALKNHVFFQDLEWAMLQDCESPLFLDHTPQVDDYRDSDLHESLQMINMERKSDKKIVLTGLVKKMKYVFMYNTRQLILKNDGILEYFHPKRNSLKGRLTLDKNINCFVKTENVFHVSSMEREYVFNTVDVPAKVWVEKIKEVLRGL